MTFLFIQFLPTGSREEPEKDKYNQRFSPPAGRIETTGCESQSACAKSESVFACGRERDSDNAARVSDYIGSTEKVRRQQKTTIYQISSSITPQDMV